MTSLLPSPSNQLPLDDGIDDDIRAFFTQRDVCPDELEVACPVVAEALKTAVNKLESPYNDALALPQEEDEEEDNTNSSEKETIATDDEQEECVTTNEEQTRQQWKEDALVKGNPRDYVSVYTWFHLIKQCRSNLALTKCPVFTVSIFCRSFALSPLR